MTQYSTAQEGQGEAWHCTAIGHLHGHVMQHLQGEHPHKVVAVAWRRRHTVQCDVLHP